MATRRRDMKARRQVKENILNYFEKEKRPDRNRMFLNKPLQLPQDNYDIQLTASEKLINEEVKNLIKIIRDLRKENQRLKKKVQEFEEEREREQEEEEREHETSDRQDECDYIIVID